MSDTFFGSIGKECTIYRDEAGFDDNFKLDIDFAKIEFEETLNVSEASSIFHVNYCGKPRVLKVKAVIGIQQIHLALVEHNDPYPKNILIVPGDQERVIWVDFDVAIVYPNDTYIEKKGRGRIEFETEPALGHTHKKDCIIEAASHYPPRLTSQDTKVPAE
ncbi:predicted protein [Histoplasma mississippiense (nom. inval.)]|uniref:predicted protein n=1 Tax=Ajellomyces capsulatus (strain NAm1 / WU24) TaxID=2059318 RepID=UPI000157B5F0|nr:predicted protein [Histoplasma mississippiense (nom. inval.)]EDN02433.1 predicted protein [Histoplasma mississippiense (nom. inval.)]